MSDIEILKELLDQSMLISLQEKQEGSRTKYFAILEETQDNYAVTVEEMPNPNEVIIVNVDKFKVIPKVFKGDKGESKRADFVIIANTHFEKIILIIELKKTKKSRDWIMKQLIGAKCFILYCQALVKNFWNKQDFLEGYDYRFITIGHITTDKRRTQTNKKDQTQKAQIHDSPEKMLKIKSTNSLKFERLI